MHRRNLLALMGGAACALLVVPPAFGQTWRVFSRPDLGFSIELPGEPKVTEDELPVSGGSMKTVSADLELGDLLLSASVTLFPPSLRDIPPVERIAQIRDHLVEVAKVPLISEKPFMLGGLQAADLVFGMEALHMVTRIVATSERLYQASASRSVRLDDDPVVRRVINSFKVLS